MTTSKRRTAGWELGQHHRVEDLVAPVWGLFDMSPEHSGDFLPKLSHE